MVLHAEAFGNSALFYEILDHPEDVFQINPSTGHIINQWPLDFEHVNFFNFSLTVTNTLGMLHLFATPKGADTILEAYREDGSGEWWNIMVGYAGNTFYEEKVLSC